MNEQPDIEYVLGGIAALHETLEEIVHLLKKQYNVDMTILAHDSPEIFNKLDFVHNTLGMYMEDDWEDHIE